MAAPAITTYFSRHGRTCTRYSGPGAPGPAVAVIPRHSCTTSHLPRVIPGHLAAGHTARQSHPGHPARNQAVTGWGPRPGSHTPDISQLAWGEQPAPGIGQRGFLCLRSYWPHPTGGRGSSGERGGVELPPGEGSCLSWGVVASLALHLSSPTMVQSRTECTDGMPACSEIP